MRTLSSFASTRTATVALQYQQQKPCSLRVQEGKGHRNHASLKIVIEAEGKHKIEGKSRLFSDIGTLLKYYEESPFEPAMKTIGQPCSKQDYESEEDREREEKRQQEERHQEEDRRRQEAGRHEGKEEQEDKGGRLDEQRRQEDDRSQAEEEQRQELVEESDGEEQREEQQEPPADITETEREL